MDAARAAYSAVSVASKDADPLPVTVLSGFLGAGKTSTVRGMLLNRRELRIAVLVNDLASVNVDAADIRRATEGEDGVSTIELENGCLCCGAPSAGANAPPLSSSSEPRAPPLPADAAASSSSSSSMPAGAIACCGGPLALLLAPSSVASVDDDDACLPWWRRAAARLAAAAGEASCAVRRTAAHADSAASAPSAARLLRAGGPDMARVARTQKRRF